MFISLDGKKNLIVYRHKRSDTYKIEEYPQDLIHKYFQKELIGRGFFKKWMENLQMLEIEYQQVYQKLESNKKVSTNDQE